MFYSVAIMLFLTIGRSALKKFGVPLGCNGIVHNLFEPVKSKNVVNPIALMQAALAQEKCCCTLLEGL